MQNNEKMKSANMLNYSHLRWFDIFLDPVMKIGNSGESYGQSSGTRSKWKSKSIEHLLDSIWISHHFFKQSVLSNLLPAPTVQANQLTT